MTTGASFPKAKKSLGQNFLQDANIARKIVSALELDPMDDVIEIGPGPGALTGILCQEPFRRLVLIDKDDHWASVHAEKYARGKTASSLPEAMAQAEEGGVGVAAADALAAPWEILGGEGWKFVGNLPYNIASPLMWDIASESMVNRAVFMIQKEVAERIVAKPGSSAYGALSVWIQSFVTPKLLFIVPPQVFHPRPKVHSAVVAFYPKETINRTFDKDALSRLLKLAFQQRRKQLGTIFKSFSDFDTILRQNAIKREQRPETLTPQQFHILSNAMFFSERIDNNG